MARRIKTKYVGVYYTMVAARGGKKGAEKKHEKCFYITFKKPGERKQSEEKVGRASEGWSDSKANNHRIQRINGTALSTREEAEKKRAEKEPSPQEELSPQEEPWTIDKAWKAYEEGKSLAGLAQDKSRYKNHIQPALGKKVIASLKTHEISQVRKKLEEKKLAPQTVKHVLALLRRILLWGHEQELFDKPTRLKFDMPEFDNEKTEYLTPEQLATFLTILQQEQEENPVGSGLIQLALFTGMRRGQMLRLRWKTDVDFHNGQFRVYKKGKKKDHYVPIPMNDSARELLESFPHLGAFVFPSQRGPQLHDPRKAVNKVYAKIREKVTLPEGFRPLHGLRHNFATWIASYGETELHTLQQLLTHSDIRTTQRYAHLFDEVKKQASQKIATKFQQVWEEKKQADASKDLP